MLLLDAALVDATEWICRRVQRLTGTTNVWLAVQLTNLSIIGYFVWAAAYFWRSDAIGRIAIAAFCGTVFYALTRTVFKVPIETSENDAYRRVASGMRNPRRLRDALLRISFVMLSCTLAYPVFFVYTTLRLAIFPLTYCLVVLTTAVLYLLACDPLPPCRGKVRDWIDAMASARSAGAASVQDAANRGRSAAACSAAARWIALTPAAGR
jgi:hypothetical protein